MKTSRGAIEVEPYVILYAIRYGLGRLTYAHNDAIGLIKEHWPHLEAWSSSIIADLERVIRTTTSRDIRDSADAMLDWIQEQQAK